MINKKLFTQANLNGSNQLIYTHNLNKEDVVPFLTDNNGVAYPINDIFSLGDISDSGNDKANKVSLSFPDVITGEWKLLLDYQGASETSSGRRGFELTENNEPDDDFRVILGKVDTPSVNITLTNLFARLLTKLAFLKTGNNLSDLSNKETARTNLGVSSTSEINTALATKASLYQTGSGAVLGVSNTAVFTPTADYHPSTMKYALEKGGGRLLSGSTSIGDITANGGAYQSYTISLGATLPNTNYKVLFSVEDANGYGASVTVKSKSTTEFVVNLHADYSGNVENITLRWKVETL